MERTDDLALAGDGGQVGRCQESVEREGMYRGERQTERQ